MSTTAENPRTYTVGQVYDVEPAALLIGTNVRHDVKTRDDFAQSIRARGVLEPVTAYEDQEGHLVILRGQRRTLTAQAVGTPSGTIPVRVVDQAEDADRIVDQLSENIHRAAMDQAEEVAAIEQLALLGVSAAQIAKRTAVERPTVDRVLSVSKHESIRERLSAGDVTLEQAAALAEFDGDPQAQETIERAIRFRNPLAHAIERARQEQAERVEVLAEVERLRAEGIPALDPAENPDRLWEVSLTNLTRIEDGEHVPEADWPSVPGAAVVVSARWAWVEVEDQDAPEVEDVVEDLDHDEDEDEGYDYDDGEEYDEGGERVQVRTFVLLWVCLDPEAAGLQYAPHGASRAQGTGTQDDAAEAEAKRVERRRVLAGNKAWRAAQTVRRDWLRTLVARKTPPKDAEFLICSAVLTGPHWLRQGMERSYGLLAEMLPAQTDQDDAHEWYRAAARAQELAQEPATVKAATMRTLAAILTAWEAHTDVQTWRRSDEWDRRVMEALIGWGYEPCDVERALIGEPYTLTAPTEVEDQDDEQAA